MNEKLKIKLLIDVITQSPNESFLECTDYLKLIDISELDRNKIIYDFNSSTLILKFSLFEKNKNRLINFLNKLSFFPMQEIHIYLNGEKIFESYDSFDCGIVVSKKFIIDKLYLDNGISVQYNI